MHIMQGPLEIPAEVAARAHTLLAEALARLGQQLATIERELAAWNATYAERRTRAAARTGSCE
jgi:hypothetical protein